MDTFAKAKSHKLVETLPETLKLGARALILGPETSKLMDNVV
jgi:hypothetical protein